MSITCSQARNGINCSVRLGENQVLGMGTFSFDGITVEDLDATTFGDTWKRHCNGLKDGGTVSFSGFYVPYDTTGQDLLRTALDNSTEITNLRFYIDLTSYWEPNYSNANAASYILITAAPVTADKGQLMTCEFQGRVSGNLVLVSQ